MKTYICNRKKDKFLQNNRRGAGVVTEQIANLSTGDCRQGSSPCLSAFFSGCSVARLSRLLWEQEAAGSNPATPTITILGCVAQLDRATHF